MTLICGPLNSAYASKEEVLDLEEEKSDIEDMIEEHRTRGKSHTNICFE